MNKERFDREMNKIKVPKKDVYKAIENGIEMGKKNNSLKKKSKRKLTAMIVSVAAVMFLASGLIFAPITNVFASVPIIGSIYEKFSLQIGQELMKSHLITELNQEATNKGVDVTITSAYYDGNVIGITFKADGKGISMDNTGGDQGPETGYNFHLFDGNEQGQWSSGMTELRETDNGYKAAIEFYNPKENLPANFTLPLTFTYMAGVKGEWRFDVPVERIPFEAITAQTDDTSSYEGYALTMKSVIKGKATTLLEYDIEVPSIGKEDEMELTVFDDLGNRLSKNHANVLHSEQNNGVIQKEVRELFTSKIDEDAKYLMVHPQISKYEKDTVKSMDQSTPFVVKSSRFEYQITVNSIKQKGNKLIVDYNIQNVNTGTIRQDLIQNFADFIHVMDSDKIKKDGNDELDIGNMLEFMIRSEQAKLINKEELHFQSIFVLQNPDKFTYEDYALMVPFGTLSANDKPIKMDPIKIDLTK